MEVSKNKYQHNNDGTTTIFIESKKHGTKEVLIDTEDHDKVSGYRWRLCLNVRSETHFYVQAHIPHPDGGWSEHRQQPRRRRRTALMLHRLIMDAPKDKQVDHIEHDTLDNRKCKLRLCSNQENAFNRGRPKNNQSGFKGVTYRKQPKNMINEREKQKPWEAQLQLNGKKIYIGYYKTKEEAAAAYDKKCVEVWGKPVCPEISLNFPEKLSLLDDKHIK